MKQFKFFSLFIFTVIQSSFGQYLDNSVLPPCYGDLGCFPVHFPWMADTMPQSPKELDLTFQLYTNENINNSIDFDYDFNENQLINSTFVFHKRVVFLIGGVNSSFDNDGWQGQLKNSILYGKPDQFNVFGLHWLNRFRHIALANVEVVGSALAAFIKRLVKNTNLRYSHIHLIGDGLGAAIASYAGKKIQNPKIARITGLNPESTNINETTLAASDAIYVDIVYTDYTESGIVNTDNSDHKGLINFYINEGAAQASCLKTRGISDMSDSIDMELHDITEMISCNHKFAHRMIRMMPADLPKKCEFIGYQCGSYDDFEKGFCHDCGDNNEKCFIFSILGINDPALRYFYKRQLSSRDAGKKYYFKTLAEPPFCLYHYGFEISFASPFSGSIMVEVYGALSQHSFRLELATTEPVLIIRSLLKIKEGLGQLNKIILKSLDTNLANRISSCIINFMSNLDPGVRDEWSAVMLPDKSVSNETHITLFPFHSAI